MADMTVTDYLLRKVLAHDDRLNEVEIRVGAVKDYADRINAYTTAQGEDLATVRDLVSGVVTKLEEVDAELASELAPAVDRLGVITDNLDAVANPTAPENPVPVTEDPAPGEEVPPTV